MRGMHYTLTCVVLQRESRGGGVGLGGGGVGGGGGKRRAHGVSELRKRKRMGRKTAD